MDFVHLQQLGVSLALGLLVGLERERAESSIAGIRTFPLISVFGTVCAQIGYVAGGWIVAAGLVSLAATLIFANIAKMKSGDPDPGITTEVAALLLFGLGALIVYGTMQAAVVMGGAMAVLLHLKDSLHRFSGRVGDRDMRAMMQFVVLSLVILPVLPNKGFGPYEVWNPFKIWLMVVLIVGISLGGYVAYKLFGAKAGALLGGAIGGLISSTATTVSFARRSASSEAAVPLAALVIMIAACISFARVVAEIGVVAPGNFLKIAPPLIVMFVVTCGISAGLYFVVRKQQAKLPEQKNPAELKSALVFGGMYAFVLLAVAFGEKRFGDAGLYIVAIISGLTDMDAITLSAAQMTNSGLSPTTAWKTILLASMANFLFKFGIVASLGHAKLKWRVAAAFGAALTASGALLVLWPGELVAD
jgi:uncharacterized membrane protein (DUF4010 family)